MFSNVTRMPTFGVFSGFLSPDTGGQQIWNLKSV
jgi:hypothetical protein